MFPAELIGIDPLNDLAVIQIEAGEELPDPLPLGAAGRAAIPALFAAAGEPLKSTLEPSELASALAAEWEVTYDEDATGWRALGRSAAAPARAFLSERLAVANRLAS